MTTENKRVAAYLPQDLYNHLEAFKGEHGLTESRAIGSILAAHFGVAHGVSQKVVHQFVTVSQFRELEQRVAQIGESLNELREDPPADPSSGQKTIFEAVGQLSSSESIGVSAGELPKLSCPKCSSTNIGKDGRDKQGNQRYRCKDCNRRFK